MAAGKCGVTGKVQYHNRREARLALNKLKVRRAGHKTERSAYHCRFCNQWHLTSMGERHSDTKPRMHPAPRRWRWTGALPATNEEEE